MKTCVKCGAEKPRTEFSARKRAPDGRQSYCRPCAKSALLFKRYGITGDQWERMRVDQGNACASCRRGFTTTPHTDHCHTTGKVRGLTCGTCNQMLGLAYHNPAVLRMGADYLERN